MTPAQCEKIADMRERGKSYRQIGLAIGLSPGAVSWHCLRQAIEPPNPRPPSSVIVGPLEVKRGDHVVRRFTPEDDALLLALHNQGFGIRTIGKRMGRRDNSVRGRLMCLARRDERALLLEQRA